MKKNTFIILNVVSLYTTGIFLFSLNVYKVFLNCVCLNKQFKRTIEDN